MPTVEPTNPLKRRRTEDELEDDPLRMSTDSDPNAQSVDATRSEVWFDDGSVVLQAANVQFKVHRSVLCRHSSVFRDVFSMPHPRDEPTVDSCPVIHLQDSAEDLKHMLLALYDKSYNTRDPIPFSAIAAMIRLGRKYEIDHLRDEALLRLTVEFPTTLSEWENLAPNYTQIIHEEENDGLLYDIVNLAHQNDIKSILPAAYYLCLQEIEALLNGAKRPDGSTSRVSFDVQRACIFGREKLLRAQAEDTFAWVDDAGRIGTCLHPTTCRQEAAVLTKAIWKPLPEPGRTFEKWTDFSPLVEKLCHNCMKYGREGHSTGRQKVWDQLPSYFGLPDWNELKNFET